MSSFQDQGLILAIVKAKSTSALRLRQTSQQTIPDDSLAQTEVLASNFLGLSS